MSFKNLTLSKRDQLKTRFRPSDRGFTFLTSTGETIELTHQDIALIADFDSFTSTDEYRLWFRYNYGR